jgi:hypothetical protein
MRRRQRLLANQKHMELGPRLEEIGEALDLRYDIQEEIDRHLGACTFALAAQQWGGMSLGTLLDTRQSVLYVLSSISALNH